MRVEFFVPAWQRPAAGQDARPREDNKSPARKMKEAALLQMDGLPPTEAPVKLDVILLCYRPESHLDPDGDVLPRFADAVPERGGCPLSMAGVVESALSGIVYKSATQIHSVRTERQYGSSGVFVAAE